MKIRTAKKNDLIECEKISKVSELLLNSKTYPDRKYLIEFLGPLFIIAEEDNKIAGYILGEKEKAKILSLNLLVVDRKKRGKGLGKLLLNEFLKRAKKLGFKELYSFVPRWNEKTMEFYKRNGFSEMKNYAYFTKEI